ncbi:hypothetical protein [Peribacillus frigoritolerans]|uniref:hypothetical protein n=1 Tax=Peribacillus frigoritolerans TaxID=450367 RepID=UPI003F7EAF33
MKNKRLNKVLMSLGIALMIPTSAFASVEPLSAGWNNKGSQSPTIYTNKYVSTGKSTGGNLWEIKE